MVGFFLGVSFTAGLIALHLAEQKLHQSEEPWWNFWNK